MAIKCLSEMLCSNLDGGKNSESKGVFTPIIERQFLHHVLLVKRNESERLWTIL